MRGIRRAPGYVATVAATIGLGLGLLTSVFTLVNAYVLRHDRSRPHRTRWSRELGDQYRQAPPVQLSDFESARDISPHFAGLAAGRTAIAMQDSAAVNGPLVSDTNSTLLGAGQRWGRTLQPGDATALVVLSDRVWRHELWRGPVDRGTDHHARTATGRGRGSHAAGAGLTGEELVVFWAPLASARPSAWLTAERADTPSLTVVGRLRQHGTAPQVRAWLQLWLEQR